MWAKLKRELWQWRGVGLIGPGTAIIILVLRAVGALQPLELALLDQFFCIKPAGPQDERIAIVAIDEEDIQEYGYPINDATLAQLLEALQKQKPRVIGLDIFRDIPVEPGHDKLVTAFRSMPNLVGIRKVVADRTGFSVQPPPALNPSQVAANDVIVDPDGKVRRALFSLNDNQQQPVISLGADLALRFLEAEGIQLEVMDAATQTYRIGQAVFQPLKLQDGAYVHADIGGYQVISNFHSLKQGFRSISMRQVLQGRMPPDFVRDRLVLVGVEAESVGDRFLTPYSSEWFGRSPKYFSGVSVHADISSQLLSAAADGYPPMRVWSKPLEWLWILGWSTTGALICWAQRYRQMKTSKNRWWKAVPFAALSITLLLGALGAGTYIAFLNGWWLPLAPALLGLVGASLIATGYIARTAAGIRRTFGRYLSDEIVANLLETPSGLKLGGEKRRVTLLFADLRGFSAIAERISPEQAVDIINLYLHTMTDVINQHQGTINEFMGDGIFVIFGAPIRRDDDTQRAIACALAMQLGMDSINAKLLTMNLPALEMGIGLHTGEVLAGNIGSHQRAKYTVIGRDVNLASRIESYTVGGQVLVSKETLKAAGPIVRVDGQMWMQPKGFMEPLTLYEIGGIGGKFNLFLPKADDALVPLKHPIPVQFLMVENKHLASEVFQGQITQLAAQTAELYSAQPIDLLTNLQISLLTGDQKAKGLSDLYAKVVEQPTQSRTLVRVRFTAIPPEVVALFHYLRQSSG